MSTTSLTVRRSVAALTIAVVSALAFASGASAKKVTSKEPWQPDNRYLVTANVDGRALPQLNPVAKVNHRHQGDWVKIECQTTGENAYGSNIWDKVGGLYVPDKYVKTYKDGLLNGAPRCSDHEPTPVPAGPTRDELAAAVNAVEYERVYGSNYRIYKEKYPNNGIIWDNNGCSVPEKILKLHPRNIPLGKAASYYSNLFEKSCDRHDFGYRNYGGHTDGLKLDPTEARRATIDDQLHKNMDYQCKKVFDRKYVEAVQRGACYKASDIFYWAVHNYGQSKF
jgi:hypothetical protein